MPKFHCRQNMSGNGNVRFAVVCASNMNRSMEAHNFLQKKGNFFLWKSNYEYKVFLGYNIQSYGTGNMIKIPGKSEREPNSYPFGTTYDFIYDDLKTKDQELYTKNGMLHIMERNRRIKVGFSLIICFCKIILLLERSRKVSRVYQRVWDHSDSRGESLWSSSRMFQLARFCEWDSCPCDQHERCW